jgi:Winged helix DNA-binding domain
MSVLKAVERLAGMQAQEAKPPFIGLWTRLAGFERDQLQRALHRRKLVRATWLRGTLHLVTAKDYATLRTTLAPMLSDGLRVLGDRAEGLDVERLLPVAVELLKDEPRNFDELRALLAQEFPNVNERALGYAVRLSLPLVMVPTDDPWGFPAKSDFTLAASWLAHPLSAADAPAKLALGYLAAFGPASATDLQVWSGLKGIKPVLEQLRPKLSVFRDERRRELFDLPNAPRLAPDAPAPARFLPAFDNLLLAHSDRTRILADEHRAAVVTKNLRVNPTFLWDGFVAGTWKIERKRAVAALRITPFAKLPRGAGTALSAEGELLLRFAEADATSFSVKLD